MPVPIIDTESDVLAFPQWVAWEHTFAATQTPHSWQITSGGFPAGMMFQPSIAVTGTASTDTINATAHGLIEGRLVSFSALTGGTGLTAATLYHVRDVTTNSFKLSATAGGAAINFTSDITAGSIFRPGYLFGTATVPGFSGVRLTATNASGASAEVLFCIGIEPAAAAPDSNTDWVWDIGTGLVTLQTSSLLNLAPPAEGEVLATVKEDDDWIARIRIIKGGTVLALMASGLRIVTKEFEPEGQIVVSTEWTQQGTGTGTSYLLYAQFSGAAFAGALGNYEGDAGTGFRALAELELTFANPESIGPSEMVKSSATFALRLERDIANNI